MATEPRFSVSIDIKAPVARVYEVMTDVLRWHEWTPSIASIRWLGDRGFALGQRATIKQPKFPPATWIVSRIDPGRRFEWVNQAPGLHVTGHHSVEPTSNGSRATLALSYAGFFGNLLARMTQGITSRFLEMEANGLKARSENPSFRHGRQPQHR